MQESRTVLRTFAWPLRRKVVLEFGCIRIDARGVGHRNHSLLLGSVGTFAESCGESGTHSITYRELLQRLFERLFRIRSP
ncbi:hypothetical protein APY03_0338 [Variovorax sp. WDL1]|nr:hypothetical protein APY03_0338 [Variovorax sp. WDL1]